MTGLTRCLRLLVNYLNRKQSPDSDMVVAQRNRAGELTAEVLSDSAAFDHLRPEWDALLDQSYQQEMNFLRHSWNQLWWEHYAPEGSCLYLVTCRNQQGELVGLAPLYRKLHRICGVPYARELLFLGMGVETKTSEYLNVIARQGEEKIVAATIAACLRKRFDWDRMRLEQVPASSATLPHFVSVLGARSTQMTCDRAPCIDTSVSWEMYKRGLGRSMRRNVEYYGRRLFKRHRCEFRRATTSDDFELAFESLVRLHQSRWRAAGQFGSFADAGLESFLRGLARDTAHAGRLRLWTLAIDGKIEAALLGFLDNRVLHYFQKGFNPDYAKEDLGNAMLGLCIRDCFDDPQIRSFDFMGGGAEYKGMWARQSRETMLYEVNRANLPALLFLLRMQASTFVTSVYRRLAPSYLRSARRDLLRKLKAKNLAALDAAMQVMPPTVLAASDVFQLVLR